MSRPGLDPGTLGFKETFQWLLCVGLVSWCYGNMRPKNEACSDLEVRNLFGEFQERIVSVRVRVRVVLPTPTIRLAISVLLARTSGE